MSSSRGRQKVTRHGRCKGGQGRGEIAVRVCPDPDLDAGTAQHSTVLGTVPAEHRPQATQLPPRPSNQRWCEPWALRACEPASLCEARPGPGRGPHSTHLAAVTSASGSVASRSMYSVRRPHNLMSRGPAKRANRRRRGWSRSRCRTGRTTRGPDGTVAALAARARGDFCPRCRL